MGSHGPSIGPLVQVARIRWPRKACYASRMQPKTAIGFVLALSARDANAAQRTAILQTLAPALRDDVERVLGHLELAPAGSKERASRLADLTRARAPRLSAWPSDARVASLVGPYVDPLAVRTHVSGPLPRRRYRAPDGLLQFLLAEADATSEDPWPA